MPRLSIIVPCFNEEFSLPVLMKRSEPVINLAFNGDAEVIAVDDGSTDQTWKVLNELTEIYSFLIIKRHTDNRGLPEAWKTGAEAARSEVICTLDADLQYRPEEIERLYRARSEQGVDILQGSRMWSRRFTDSRFMLSCGLNFLLNGLFGMSLDDNKSGFLICDRRHFLALLQESSQFKYFQTLIMVAARMRGLSYSSLPTPFDERAAGQSFLGSLPLKVTLGVARDLGRAFFRYRIIGPKYDR